MRYFAAFLPVVLVAGCSDEPTPQDAASSDGGSVDAPVGQDSSVPSGARCASLHQQLMQLDQALDEADSACREWLDQTRGRVGNDSTGSVVVWSRRTNHSVGLIVAAMHILGEGWFAPGGQVAPEHLAAPTDAGVWRVAFPGSDGEPVDIRAAHTQSAIWTFYNPMVPADETGNALRDILPRHDFFVAASDGQSFEVDPMLGLGGPLVELSDQGLDIFDPGEHTTAAATFAEPSAGEPVLLLGYPQDAAYALGAVSVGVVLGEEDANAAIAALDAAGDAEGSIEYDPEVEFLIDGVAIAGMSGGGVFNNDGDLLGVMVRSSDHASLRYVRALRLSFIVSALTGAYEAADESTQNALADLLGQELGR